MKIAIAQMEVVPCRPDLNFEKMKKMIADAKLQKAHMIVFPEMCIPGYLIGDTWEEESFVNDCIEYGNDVKELSDDIFIVFGNVAKHESKLGNDGRPRKYNVLCVANNRHFWSFDNNGFLTIPHHIKSLLPNYREFEEPRHFIGVEQELRESMGSCYNNIGVFSSDSSIKKYFTPMYILGIKIGFTICEEGWDNDYSIKPIKYYVDNGAELIINISCSPFTLGKNRSRNRVFGENHAKNKNVSILYVNATGIQNNAKTIFTIDGSSVAYNKCGEIVYKAEMFTERLDYVNFENGDFLHDKNAATPEDYTEVEEIKEALEYGVKKYLKACGLNRITIGISGGIDSALAAIVYARVVGPENVLLVNMPSEYNSKTTISISEEIAKNIGCYYVSIAIGESVKLTTCQIDNKYVFSKSNQPLVLKLAPLDLENIQARDRSSRILAAIASAWGGVFTNNGNKSESMVGYCTRYGDLAGFLAALGDLWKEQIYETARYYNTFYPVLPESIFNIVPCAELSANQNIDEGKGDPIIYWYHDQLFKTWQQNWNRQTIEDNLRSYLAGTINIDLKLADRVTAIPFDANRDVYKLFPTKELFTNDLERWYKLFKGMAVTKRVEAPPVLAINRRAFGFDYRETLNGCYFTRNYLEMKKTGAVVEKNISTKMN